MEWQAYQELRKILSKEVQEMNQNQGIFNSLFKGKRYIISLPEEISFYREGEEKTKIRVSYDTRKIRRKMKKSPTLFELTKGNKNSLEFKVKNSKLKEFLRINQKIKNLSKKYGISIEYTFD